MNEALTVLKTIWRVLFSSEPSVDITTFLNDFCIDVSLPRYVKSVWSEKQVAQSKPYKAIVSQAEIFEKLNEISEKIPQGRPLPIAELLQKVLPTLIFVGDTHYDSSTVVASDNIYKSLEVYYSRSVHNSKKVLGCANCTGLESAAACDNTGFSQFVIRAMDSINCSRCFDIYQSGKCSNCFFVSNCYDLHESILCTNLRSRRFCIGNMQFTESEYKDLKPKLLEALVFKDFQPMYALTAWRSG
jgi:hypothetical protein